MKQNRDRTAPSTSFPMPPRPLNPGDRVRVVRLPPLWATPGYRVPPSTRRVYRLMIDRRRAVRVDHVDRCGPWVRIMVRDTRGRVHHHSVTLDDGCWVRVRPRKGLTKRNIGS